MHTLTKVVVAGLGLSCLLNTVVFENSYTSTLLGICKQSKRGNGPFELRFRIQCVECVGRTGFRVLLYEV